MAKEYTVTPWEVHGDVDYNEIVKEFGTKEIDDSLLKKIEKYGKLHHFLRRKHFFAHRDLDIILKDYDKGKKFYLYTGRSPSGPIHLGHMIPWMFTKWLQDTFDAPLLFQIPDEEKFLFKNNLTMEESEKWATDNILDIIALGFDHKKTSIFKNTEYAKTMYPVAVEISKRITLSKAKAVFGYTNDTNIGSIFYTAMQSVPAFLPSIREGEPTNCLIPYAIDQDPHFRITRDVAPKLGYPKPASINCKFLPSLKGDSKMSSSINETCIYAGDSPEEVSSKIRKYAFSGGRDTLKEHRKKGGNPNIDVAYQWLTYFEEDDKKLEQVYHAYKSGELLSGELKEICIETINKFLSTHQKARAKAESKVEKFMLRD